jgi:molecular chaperone GrpE (heat shock protein)
LYYIDDEDELSQKMEMVCKEVIDLLIEYELCSIDDLDGTYFNKNKYLEMTNTANSLNDIIASSSIAQPYA